MTSLAHAFDEVDQRHGDAVDLGRKGFGDEREFQSVEMRISHIVAG